MPGNRATVITVTTPSRPDRIPHDRILRRARVGRLATADRRGQPHVVPICFAYDGRTIYSAIDEKPKRVAARRLRRVRNIDVNPAAALVVDAYREDWRRLWYVLILGEASIVAAGTTEHVRAVRLLRRKYRQYERMQLEDRPVLRISPRRVVSWSASPWNEARPGTDAAASGSKATRSRRTVGAGFIR